MDNVSEEAKRTTRTVQKTNKSRYFFIIISVEQTAVLGKNSELVIKIKNLKALQLSDPYGKITVTELTHDIEATNKSAMGTGLITIDPSNYRQELDNGFKISNEKYIALTWMRRLQHLPLTIHLSWNLV